ncbi:MAG: putative membrane protein [Saprospiraceae bacterium]|jgi:uncharacterized membrane protein
MLQSTSPLFSILLDCIVVITFLSLWASYHLYSRRMASKRDSLSNAMKAHRVAAISNVMQSETKITGAFILSNIDRNVSFFASTALLILAGLVGALAKAELIELFINNLPLAYTLNVNQIYLRLLLLIGIFVYAYFTLTWSLRQSSFASVMVGAGANNGTDQARSYSHLTAKVMDISAHSANQGLRAYYFSLAAITWLYHPVAFMIAYLLVVFVLYRREFNSKTVRLLIEAKNYL